MSGNPLLDFVNLLERSTNKIHVCVTNEPDVSAYALYAHETLAAAYGDPTAVTMISGPVKLQELPRGLTSQSKTIREKRWGVLEESRRNQTHAILDITDFEVSPGQPFDDNHWVFMRLQKKEAGVWLEYTNGVPALGPIYAIPTFTAIANAPMETGMVGIAPQVSGVDAENHPEIDDDLSKTDNRPMIIVLPGKADQPVITNLEPGKDLYVSFGSDHPWVKVDPTEAFRFYSGAVVHMLYFATTDGGGCKFQVRMSV